VLVATGCRGPRGPVVHLKVDMEKDPAVMATVHRLVVTVRSQDDGSETLLFPESAGAPITFPTDLAVVLSGVEGDVELIVEARDGAERPVGRGHASVVLDSADLFRVRVAVGVTSTCRDGLPAPDELPEVCLVRDGMDLPLGSMQPDKWGHIGNGVVFSDLDADDVLDLIAVWAADWTVPEHESGLSIYYGAHVEGVGTTYDPAEEYARGDPDQTELGLPGMRRSNTEVTVADVLGPDELSDPDGYNDLAVSSLEAEGITVWPADVAGGVFGDPKFIPLGAQTGEVHAGDVIEDLPGQELVVGLRRAGEVVVVGHVEAGQPPRVVESATMEAGAGVRGLTLADLDRDGDLDVVSAAKGIADSGTPGRLSVHVNDGARRFTSQLVGQATLGTRDVAVLDLDGDGALDLATVNEDRGVVTIHRGLPGPRYAAPEEIPLEVASGRRAAPERVRTGDVDGDGITDLVVTGPRLGSVFVLLMGEDGAPRFPLVRVFAGEEPGAPAEDLQGCAVADPDGDGVIDLLALVDRETNTLRVLRRKP